MTTRPSPSFANLARFPQPARRRRARPTAAMLIACLMLFAGPVLAGGGDGGDGGSGGMESAAPASIAGAQAAGPAEVTRLMGDQGERVLCDWKYVTCCPEV